MKRDVGGERGLAHRRAAGEDDQVRGLQAAQLAVEVAQAGRDAGDVAVALVGGLRHVERALQHVAELLRTAFDLAAFGQVEQPLSERSIWSMAVIVEIVGCRRR